MEQKKLYDDITLSFRRTEDCVNNANVTEQKMIEDADCHKKNQVFSTKIQDQLIQLESMDDELTERMHQITNHKNKIGSIDDQLNQKIQKLNSRMNQFNIIEK